MILHILPSDAWAKGAKAAAEQGRLSELEAPETPTPDAFPIVISKIDPMYSDEARKAAVSARALCALTVDKEGTPQNIRVVRGAGFGLDEYAMQALSRWRFAPAMRNGGPIAQTAQIEVSWNLMIAGHENQFARLDFTLPAGGTRPQLTHGKVPENPRGKGDARLRMAMDVGKDGKVQSLSSLEATSNEWAEKSMRELKAWQFRPATVNGQPVETTGVLEVLYAPSHLVNFHTDRPGGSVPGAMRPVGPDPNWQPKTSDEQLVRGWALFGVRQYPRAQTDAEAVLAQRPESVMAKLLCGRAAYELKEYSAAARYFDQLIQHKPDWADLYRYRGLARWHNGEQQLGLEDLLKAVSLDHYSGPSYNALGSAYTEAGEWKLARTNLDLAVEVDPDSALARESRVKLFEKQGDLAAERNEIRMTLALFPGIPWAIKASEGLSQKMR